jgi:hypothetical protein
MIKRILQDWKKYAGEKGILVYQMGKVGSTSLEKALPNCIHIHTFYNHRPCYVVAREKRNTFLKRIKGVLYDTLRRTAVKSRKKIKIISLVRDPYSRNISAFFQDFAYYIYYYSCLTPESQRDHQANDFVFKIYDDLFDHSYALNWFDKEFKKFTGIDIYKYPFDKDKGWNIITEGKYEILIIKLEKLKEAWSCIEEFSSAKMQLQNSNVASFKWYSNFYNDFITKYSPSKSYLDLMYKSKFTLHFYNKKEINFFEERALKTKRHEKYAS